MLRNLLLSVVLVAASSISSAQVGQQPGVTAPPSAAFTGGAVTSPILAATGCTTPPFSFTADANAGLCLLAADDVVVQTAASGNSRTSLRQLASQGLFSHINGSGTNSSVSVTDTGAQLDVGSSTLQLSSTLLTTSAPLQGPTGCASPAHSFTGDVDAGLCLTSANDATFQVAFSGSRGFVHLTTSVAQLEAVLVGVVGRIEAQSAALSFMANGTSVGSWTDTAFTLLAGDFYAGHLVNDDQIRIVPLTAGAGAFQGSITSVDLTAARTWTLPNISGTFQTNAGATVASAANVDLLSANIPHISGTTTITSVTIQPAGRCVSLIFDDVLTFTDGSNLKLAGNFVTTADDTISLCSDGTNWYENARSVN